MIMIFYLLILIDVFFMVYIEYKFTKVLTPFAFFVIPYVFVLGLTILISKTYNLSSLNIELLFWFLIYSICFFFISFLFYIIFKRKKYFKIKRNNFYFEKYLLDRIFIIIGFISFFYLMISFFHLYKNTNFIVQITYDSFQEKYSGGINFYFRIFLIIILTYFIGTINKFNIKSMIIIFLFYIPLVLGFVKGLLLIPIISGFILRYYLNNKINIISIFKIILMGLIIFIIIYGIQSYLNKGYINLEIFYKILEIFIEYLTSGILSFNKNLINFNYEFNNVINPTFAPFINFAAKIFNVHRINNVPAVETYVGTLHYVVIYPNVNTYIGTLMFYNGKLNALIIHCMWSVFAYLLFYKAILNKTLIDYLILSIFSFTFVMSWFDYWYLHSYWFYIIIILEIINIFIKFKIKKRRQIEYKNYCFNSYL